MNRLLLPVVTFLLAFPTARAAAQQTPEALGSEFLRAVSAGDADALRGLVHPASLRAVSHARVEQVLQAWLNLEPDPAWGSKSVSADSLQGYDATALTYALGPVEISFPAAPERFLMIVFTRPVAPGSSATITGEKTRDAIARVDGRWRILIGDVRRAPAAGASVWR